MSVFTFEYKIICFPVIFSAQRFPMKDMKRYSVIRALLLAMADNKSQRNLKIYKWKMLYFTKISDFRRVQKMQLCIELPQHVKISQTSINKACTIFYYEKIKSKLQLPWKYFKY